MSLRPTSTRTRRCRVAPLCLDDAAEFQAITDASVTARVDFLSDPFTLADAEALIRNGETGHRFLGVRALSDARLLGVIGTNPKGSYVIEVGYWFAASARGRGLATEAVTATVAALADAYPQTRVVAECHPDNRRSWSLLERAGFHATGKPGDRPGRMLFAWAVQSPSNYRFDVC